MNPVTCAVNVECGWNAGMCMEFVDADWCTRRWLGQIMNRRIFSSGRKNMDLFFDSETNGGDTEGLILLFL